MGIGISALSYYLPEKIITNDFFEYAKNDFLENKVGIRERHISADDEYTSDMAVKAINSLLTKHNIDRNEIEFLVLCTLTPDYPLPQTSSIVQHACELPKTLMAFDVRIGCSGYVYSLALAHSLINTLGYKKGLVVTADKFSHFLSYRDYSVDTLFSDTATVTLVEKDAKLFEIVNYDFGTDGNGTSAIMVQAGGCRLRGSDETNKFEHVRDGVDRAKNYLYMNGKEVMKFVNHTVPGSAKKVMDGAGITMDNIDWVVLHQANKLMLETLGRLCDIPEEKNYINLLNKGNTISGTIPIGIQEILEQNKRLNKGNYWMVSGFGVGYSWGTSLLRYVG
jgi:3-oxoacyl-[acyl-carrier-protein] synthase III